MLFRSALNDPAVAAEARAVLGPAARDLGFDSPLAQLPPLRPMVVGTVGSEALGPAARTADAASDRRHPVDERDQLGDVVTVAAGERPGERDPGRVDQEMVLGAVSGSINRARARRGAPLAEWGEGCQAGGARLGWLGAVVAARGSSLSLVRGLGAGDMMVDGDSRGRAVSGRPVFCGQRRASARARHGAFGSRPEA